MTLTPDYSQWQQRDELDLLHIDAPFGQALIARQGAQLLQYQAHGQSPMLWLSPLARFQRGKAIRGGIPLCWPWFGAHPHDSSLPQHGIARQLDWTLQQAEVTPQGASLHWQLQDSDASRALWPHAFRLALHMQLGTTLRLTLTMHNLDDCPLTTSHALHSYFPVPQVAQATVDGLDGSPFYSKPDQQSGQQQGPVTIDGLHDRVYLNAPQPLTLHRPTLPAMQLRSDGLHSAIVWNPGPAAEQHIPDVGPHWSQMLCVENGNALDNSLTLGAGESHRVRLEIAEQPAAC